MKYSIIWLFSSFSSFKILFHSNLLFIGKIYIINTIKRIKPSRTSDKCWFSEANYLKLRLHRKTGFLKLDDLTLTQTALLKYRSALEPKINPDVICLHHCKCILDLNSVEKEKVCMRQISSFSYYYQQNLQDKIFTTNANINIKSFIPWLIGTAWAVL